MEFTVSNDLRVGIAVYCKQRTKIKSNRISEETVWVLIREVPSVSSTHFGAKWMTSSIVQDMKLTTASSGCDLLCTNQLRKICSKSAAITFGHKTNIPTASRFRKFEHHHNDAGIEYSRWMRYIPATRAHVP